MKKILFVYNTKTTFTRQDINILKTQFIVDELYVSSLMAGFKACFSRINSDYAFGYFWFSSYSFIPLFFFAILKRIPYVVVAGGYDVAKIESINYGGRSRPVHMQLLRKFVLNQAARIISVSQANRMDLLEMLPTAAERNTVIYLGFKEPKALPLPWSGRKNKIITIGVVDQVTIERKGLKRFAELSKLMPEWEFVIIGRIDDQGTKKELEETGSKKFRMTGFLDDNQFMQEILESKVNLQLSSHEAFGISVVDAALLGVYPIVSDQYSLPEVVGNLGSQVKLNDLNAIKAEILRISDKGYDPVKLREDFLTKFPLDTKSEALLNLVQKI